MLIPLRQNELDKLIPSVATSNQFTSALGNPRKILQRVIKLDEEMVQKEPIQVEVQKDNFLEVEETLTLHLKVVN